MAEALPFPNITQPFDARDDLARQASDKVAVVSKSRKSRAVIDNDVAVLPFGFQNSFIRVEELRCARFGIPLR